MVMRALRPMMPMRSPSWLSTGNPLTVVSESTLETSSTLATKLRDLTGAVITSAAVLDLLILGTALSRMGMFF